MSTLRMTEQEWAEHQRRTRIRKSKTGVRSSTDARRTTGNGSSCEAAIQQTKSQRGELASSPTFAPFQLVLNGQLPSGKNQVQLLWRNGKVHKYPNKTFTNWRSRSHIEIDEQQLPAVRVPTITQSVSLVCNYWPGDLKVRDVSGQLDALFHLLVYAKVLKDDGLIYDVTWRRHELNRKFPKVVLEVRQWED